MTHLLGLLTLTLGGSLGQLGPFVAPPVFPGVQPPRPIFPGTPFPRPIPSVVQPPPPIVPVVYVPQRWFIPPHVGGDADFKGHGPIMYLNVSLYIHPNAPHEVWARVDLDAQETRNDWTRAYGVSHVPVARFARPLVQIISATYGTHQYLDRDDHNAERVTNPCATGILNAVTYIGDTVGREAGTRTGVFLEFNPILAR